jgi:hypothetical protein
LQGGILSCLVFPFDVFTHCFVLRTKGVRESFFFRVELIFSNRNFEKFLFEKISSTHLVLFLVRLLAKPAFAADRLKQ